MPRPRLTGLELQILEVLWTRGNASIREIQEAFPEPRPAYTTIQTTVYRLETKQAVRRVRKISNAHIFEPLVARAAARRRLLDEVLSFFGGRAQPMMAQLVEAGKLTRDDLRELEKAIETHEAHRTQAAQAAPDDGDGDGGSHEPRRGDERGTRKPARPGRSRR
jgi:predicted transcriptional regulator